jgi:hypothetical protein
MRLECWVTFLHNEESPSNPWLALGLLQHKRFVKDTLSTPRATRSTLSHSKIQTLLDTPVVTIGVRAGGYAQKVAHQQFWAIFTGGKQS